MSLPEDPTIDDIVEHLLNTSSRNNLIIADVVNKLHSDYKKLEKSASETGTAIHSAIEDKIQRDHDLMLYGVHIRRYYLEDGKYKSERMDPSIFNTEVPNV